jgi:twitching motility protein PilT
MRRLLEKAVRAGASDLHLTVGVPPLIRRDGEIVLLDEPPLDAETAASLIQAVMTDEQIRQFEQEWELCFSTSVPGLGYFRVTVYYKQRQMEASVRIGRARVPPLRELGLPLVLEELTRKSNGLLLITGPTGAGKTTTLNTLIDVINQERRCKIITVEDPVEYLHANLKSVIVQQEVGADTRSFSRALVHILRQDPDVIGIGELRDLETISAALTAAETGHLVIGTLHANDCPQTVNRIVDVFPERQQQQVRQQLAMTLRGVINQRLLPRADGQGRVLACSLMLGNAAVGNLIRENKLSQLYNTMVSGRKEGMLVLDEMLRDLYQKALIGYDTALAHASDPRALLKGGASRPHEAME